MAEVLATAASAIAIIQISERIIQVAKFYIESYSNTPSDLRIILVELSSIRNVFQNLEFLHQCDHIPSECWARLEEPIRESRRLIAALEKLMPPSITPPILSSTQGSRRKKIEFNIANLAWPLRANKARDLLGQLSQFKNTLSLALTSQSLTDISVIKGKVTEIHSMLDDEQRHRVYTWLQLTDPSPLHNRAQSDYEIGTGTWMLRTPAWSLWLAGNLRCIQIHGIPGAGKTVLASFLIEQIKLHLRNRPNQSIGHAYYYCYFGHSQDETLPMLKWVLGQLSRQCKCVSPRLWELYNAGVQPSILELLSELEIVLRQFEVTYVVLDALDESHSPREEFLKVIRDLASDARFSKLKLLVTSREYVDIEHYLDSVATRVSMSNPFVEQDIHSRVGTLLRSQARLKSWPQDLIAEVQATLSKRARGMFRWAVCQLDILRRVKSDKSTILKTLETLPKTLDETYERIFQAIPEEEWPVVRHILHWIWYHSESYTRSLSSTMLIRIIEEISTESDSPWNDAHYDMEIIRELCGCLIRITDGLVTFAHYTVAEYLMSQRITRGNANLFAISEEDIVPVYAEFLFWRVKRDLTHLTALAELMPRRLWTGSKTEAEMIQNMIDTDFTFYCSVSAYISCRMFSTTLASQKNLPPSLLEFFNPRAGLLGPFSSMLTPFTSLDYMGYSITIDRFLRDELIPFTWDLDCTPQNEQMVTTLNLFFLEEKRRSIFYTASYNSPSALAQSYLRANITQDFITATLKFKLSFGFLSIRTILRASTAIPLYVEGTLLEILCQISMDYNTEALIQILMDHGRNQLDYSTLLVLYAGGHSIHSTSRDHACVMRRMLMDGADPNAAIYKVTPLQLAVAQFDNKGVKQLLEAGADPNSKGNPDGVAWGAEHYLHDHMVLYGQSPLSIVRQHHKSHKKLLREYWKETESLLLQHGAVESQGDLVIAVQPKEI